MFEPKTNGTSRTSHTYVDTHARVSASQVVKDRCLVEVRHVGHVRRLLELGGVHLLDVILLHGQGLRQNSAFRNLATGDTAGKKRP